MICNTCGADNVNNDSGYCKFCLSSLQPADEKDEQAEQDLSQPRSNQEIDSQKQELPKPAGGVGIMIEKRKTPPPMEEPEPPDHDDIDHDSTADESDQSEPEESQFEIKEVDFDHDSVPGLVSADPDSEGSFKQDDYFNETDKDNMPFDDESIDDELSPYQDDDIQIAMENTENGPQLTIDHDSDFSTVPEIPPQQPPEELVDEPPKKLQEEQLHKPQETPLNKTSNELLEKYTQKPPQELLDKLSFDTPEEHSQESREEMLDNTSNEMPKEQTQESREESHENISNEPPKEQTQEPQDEPPEKLSSGHLKEQLQEPQKRQLDRPSNEPPEEQVKEHQDIQALQAELDSTKDDNSKMTQKIIINPQIEEKSQPADFPKSVSPPEKQTEKHAAVDLKESKVHTDIAAAENPKLTSPEKKPKFDEELIAKAMQSPKPAKAFGIAYIDGNTVSFAGGYKPNAGDQIMVNDKAFDLKEKPPSLISKLLKIPRPALIGGGAFLLLIIIAIITSVGPTENGQIVGILTDPSTRLTIAKATITLKELGQTVETSYAGFFVFDDVPPGIYTIILEDDGVGIVSERMTVLENKTSTITLSPPVNETKKR